MSSWVDPMYLQAALDDITDMLETASKDRKGNVETYTWTFRSNRGRYVTLEVAVRQVSSTGRVLPAL